MPSFEVIIKTKGFQEIQVFFKGTMRRMNDVTAPLKQGRLLMLRSIDKNFQVSGRPTWEPLKRSTLISKIRRGYSSKTLIRTGLLIKSIVGEIRGKNKLVMGTPVAYGRYHQEGKGVPKRPFLMYQDDDLQRINQLITDYIVNGN